MRRRAFTLAEAIVTVALVGSVFVIAGDLLDGALKTMHFQSYKTVTEQAAQTALQKIISDSTEAVNISIPTDHSSYTITKVDPSISLSNRFPGFPPGTPPATWSPYTYLCNVTYSVTAGTLNRQVTAYDDLVAGASMTSPVAFNLNTMTCTNPTDGSGNNCTVVVSLTIQEQDLVRVLDTTIWLPTSNPN